MPSSPLLGVPRLADLLAADPPTLLDVRWRLGDPHGHEHYLAGHLPGAAYVDLGTELAAPAGAGGRHPLPGPAVFQRAMRAHGVGDDRPVVVYDADRSVAAARCWWLLRYCGHRDVRVLDGGYAAWCAAGGPVEPGEVRPAEGDFTAEPGQLPVVAAEDVPALARRGLLLDARTPERFRGEAEPVDPVAGHIPGAVNLEADALVAEDGRFLPAALLRDRLERAGLAAGVEVGAYCGSGVTAAHTVLALEHLGITAALYPGSWSEWVTDPSRPVATGTESAR